MPRLALAAAALLLLAAPSAAQSVSGTVLDDDTDDPVRSALVELRSGNGRALGTAVTDSVGAFHLPVPEPGLYRLRARRIGYQDVESPGFQVAAAESVEVHLAISVRSVSLTPLTITSRPEAPRNLMLERVGFYQREQRNNGVFMRRDRIERNNGGRLSDLLSETAGVRRVTIGGVSTITLNRQAGCSPRVVVDGQPLVEWAHIDDIVAIGSIEAMEIYRGPSQTPAQFAQYETGCGLLVIWTRNRR